MRSKRILCHQLGCNFGSEPRIESPPDVDRGQFPVLGVDVRFEFLALSRKVRMFRIRLRTDRDVLAGRHGHGAGHEAGEPCDQHGASVGARGRNADYEARGRDDAVVGAENRRAKPADAA